MALPSARSVRVFALLAMTPTAIWAGVALTRSHVQKDLAPGPLISAHADVYCKACHTPTSGTVRQQLQAQLRYVLGRRENPVDFGYAAVTSDECLECHQRPNERHPIYRFQEPRFAKAVELVDARGCLGCHSEHIGRIVVAAPTFCSACHEDLKLKNDPVEIPHETLVSMAGWDTCLGCHDFHGNHKYKAPARLSDRLTAVDIRAYFDDGPDPFGARKSFEAINP